MPTATARRARAATYLFVAAVFVTLAAFYQVQASHLRGVVHRLDVEAWDQCHDRALNIAETQNLRSALVAHDPSLALIYDRHRLIVPDCGERP